MIEYYYKHSKYLNIERRMLMLKKNVKKQLCVLMVLIVALCSMTVPTAAAETSDIIVFSDVAMERTPSEADELLEIYNELFPEEYKYIIEYKDYGVKDIGDEEIAVSVYKTAKKRWNRIYVDGNE